MSRRLVFLLAATLVSAPVHVSAQGLGVAARAGTLGIGVEGAFGLTNSLVFRGGLGLVPLTVDPSSFWDMGAGVDAELELPKTWINLGADFYLGPLRIGGGILMKPDDPTITGALSGMDMIDIGGTTYSASDAANVVATLDSADQAPYALIGFGRHTATGIGFFLDLGVAFLEAC